MKFEEFKICNECEFCKIDEQWHEDYRHPNWVIHDWEGDCCYCDKIGISFCRFCCEYCRNSGCTRALHQKENQCCYCEGAASLDEVLVYEDINTSKDQ